MYKAKLVFVLLFIPVVIFAQDVPAKESRFDFFSGLTYNFHTFEYPNQWNEPGTYKLKSNFPGIEFGFNIAPKKVGGLYLSYRNNFLGELLFYAIFEPSQGGKIGAATDYSIGNGFFGRFDLGLRLGEKKQFGGGLVISDKWVTGMRGPTEDLSRVKEIDGFHFTPGIYGEFLTPLGSKNEFKAGLSLQQSVINFWQFGEEVDYGFQYPLFVEAEIRIQNHSGIYIRMGSILVIPYSEISPNYRISIAVGYIF